MLSISITQMEISTKLQVSCPAESNQLPNTHGILKHITSCCHCVLYTTNLCLHVCLSINFCSSSWHVQHEGQGQVGCLEGCWRSYTYLILNFGQLNFVFYHNTTDTLILVVSQDCVIVVAKLFGMFAGKSKEEAMNDYITKVKQLLEEAACSQ